MRRGDSRANKIRGAEKARGAKNRKKAGRPRELAAECPRIAISPGPADTRRGADGGEGPRSGRKGSVNRSAARRANAYMRNLRERGGRDGTGAGDERVGVKEERGRVRGG